MNEEQGNSSGVLETQARAGCYERLRARWHLFFQSHGVVDIALRSVGTVFLLFFLASISDRALAYLSTQHTLHEFFASSLTAATRHASLLGWFAGIIVFWWQVERARFNQRVDLIIKLSERFDRPEMRKLRAKAAQALQDERVSEIGPVDDVLNFFEELGFLLTHRAVDIESVYEFFEEWVTGYWQLAEQSLREKWMTDQRHSTYSNLRKMISMLRDHELVRTGFELQRSAQDIKEFLSGETGLNGGAPDLHTGDPADP
jgi:hypothetical protein